MATKKKATTQNTYAKELATLASLNKPKLWARYEEVFGKKTKSHNVQHLRAAIAKKLAGEKAKSVPAKKGADAAKRAAQAGRDPRLPAVGSVLERRYHDTVHKVRVLDDGFEYRSERYRSLSGIAKAITGHEYNGFLFFGLLEMRKPTKEGQSASAEAR